MKNPGGGRRAARGRGGSPPGFFLCVCGSPCGSAFFAAVVVDFDAEYNHRADCCDDVGDYKGPVFEHYALNYEEDGAESEHAECGECDAVGASGADCGYSLREISEDHAHGCRIADDGKKECVHVYGFRKILPPVPGRARREAG